MYIFSTILGPHLNILGPAPFTNLAPPLLNALVANKKEPERLRRGGRGGEGVPPPAGEGSGSGRGYAPPQKFF
jgi:hypothetical protein